MPHDEYKISPEEIAMARNVLHAVAAWGVTHLEEQVLFNRTGGVGPPGYHGLVSEWAERYAGNDAMRDLCEFVVLKVPQATWFMLEEAISYMHAKTNGQPLKPPVGVAITPDIKPDPGTTAGRYQLDQRAYSLLPGPGQLTLRQYEADALAVFDAVYAWAVENPTTEVQLLTPRQANRAGDMVDGIMIGTLSKWATTFAGNDATLQLCARVTRLVPNATYVQLVAALDLVMPNPTKGK